MHLLVLIQEDFPQSKKIDEFIRLISSKNYSATHLHSSWNRIRAREIKLFDFQIPEKIEKEVLADLMPYEVHGIAKLSKILDNPLLARFAKKFRIEKIDRKGIQPNGKRKLPIRLSILGKYKDYYDKDRELL